MNSREPYTLKRCMKFAWHDIKRVWNAYVIGDCSWGKNGHFMRHEIKCILLEIKHGVFDQGK